MDVSSKSHPPGDLEEGEIEDGELPDEEEGETNPSKSKGDTSSAQSVSAQHPSIKVQKSIERIDKTNEASHGRMSRRKALHHNSDRNNELEEDWACAVEKKLKAAIGKDISTEKVNGSPVASTSEKTVSTEDDKKNRRKKRKKKHKDDEDDRKETKKRKKSHHWDAETGTATNTKEKPRVGENMEEDDDEMLFVRGASPVMRDSFGGNEESHSSKYKEKGFSFNQQGREDFGRGNPPLSDDEAPKRGLGRGAKRRQRTVGRILPPSNKRQTRKDTKSKRGGIKRQQPSRSNSDREPNVCMFYMQGKCQKGEDCPYSHNVCPPRKMELCKFYLMDCCAKKDKCLYMHHDFPCKFFHTGLKCFSGPRCKFSHGHLSDTLRSILLKGTEGNRHNELRLSNRPSVPSQEHRSKHLETAPKDLLGDFPRLSREGAAAMVFNKKNRSSKAKKIPSLFDIEVPIPAQLLAEQKETSKDQSPRRTPIPDSDNEDQDGTTTPMPQSPASDGKAKGKSQRWGSDDVHGSHSRDSKEEENPSGGDEEEKKSSIPKFCHETDSDSGNKKAVEKERLKLDLHRLAGYSPNPADENKNSVETNTPDKSPKEEKDTKKKSDDKKSHCDLANADSGNESNDAANIPLHLPKKQRELFLRIQQQQREAESSQDPSGDHEDENDVIPEENWYSSDDEEDSLTNVLKNLSKQDQQSISQAETSALPPAESIDKSPAVTTLPLKIPDLSKIKIDESFTKLLSSICGKTTSDIPESNVAPATSTPEQGGPQPSNTSVARDPRLSRDPRSRSQTSGSVASSAAGVFAAALETVTTAAASKTSVTISPSVESSSSTSSSSVSRRSDPRRIHDPRAAKSSHKNESHDHKHSGSISSRRSSGGSHSTSFPSIYSNAIMGEKTSTHSSGLGLSMSGNNTGDIDLRNFLPRTLDTGDVDLRSRSDTDLRTGQPPTSLVFGDTDLRLRSHDLLNVGQVDGNRNNNDVDLRMLELPFKPVPMHTPATEIEASLTSHPPIPYKVVVVTIPRPDYTSLKLNTSDPQVQSDPRLRKIFKLHSPAPETSSRSTSSSSAVSVSRSDPRRQSSRSSSNSSSNTSVSTSASTSVNTSVSTSASNSTSNNPSNNVPSTNHHHHHHENIPEPFSASQSQNVISKPTNDMSNVNPLVLPNTGMRTTPTSSPLLPNPPAATRIVRDPRSAPGLLGPAPMSAIYCPNTPMFEEQADLSIGMDNDPRVMFSRGSVNGTRWEQPTPGSTHMPRGNWRNNRRNQQTRYEQDYNSRSYTPPI